LRCSSVIGSREIAIVVPSQVRAPAHTEFIVDAPQRAVKPMSTHVVQLRSASVVVAANGIETVLGGGHSRPDATLSKGDGPSG
jgi:hypothetical protein